jgi:hypothetical protein
MKYLVRLALLLIVGVLVYNYFLGSEEEKATSEKVFKQVKEVGRSIGDLVKNEREKFKDGKYDTAFDKLGEAYEKLKGKVDNEESGEDREVLKELEKQKDNLLREKEKIERELDKENPDEEIVRNSPDFDEELRKLMDETSRMVERVMKRDKEKKGQ